MSNFQIQELRLHRPGMGCVYKPPHQFYCYSVSRNPSRSNCSTVSLATRRRHFPPCKPISIIWILKEDLQNVVWPYEEIRE